MAELVPNVTCLPTHWVINICKQKSDLSSYFSLWHLFTFFISLCACNRALPSFWCTLIWMRIDTQCGVVIGSWFWGGGGTKRWLGDCLEVKDFILLLQGIFLGYWRKTEMIFYRRIFFFLQLSFFYYVENVLLATRSASLEMGLCYAADRMGNPGVMILTPHNSWGTSLHMPNLRIVVINHLFMP